MWIAEGDGPAPRSCSGGGRAGRLLRPTPCRSRPELGPESAGPDQLVAAAHDRADQEPTGGGRPRRQRLRGEQRISAGGTRGNGTDLGCAVSVSVPGWGGPDSKVGEKVPTSVDGRPAVRSGAGAEFSYLIWPVRDGSWAEVSCDGLDDAEVIASIADRVRLRPASFGLPFDPAPPDGWGYSSVQTDLTTGSATVYLGRARSEFGGLSDDSDVASSYDCSCTFGPPQRAAS